MTPTVAEPPSRHDAGPFGPILAGLAVAGGAFACATLLGARAQRRTSPALLAAAPASKVDSLAALLWPPALLALTAQGLRVWSAPPSGERTRALGLWSAAQVLSAGWMAWGSRRLAGPTALAAAALATAATFVWRARQVETPGPGPAAAALGWIGVARVLANEVRPHHDARPTVH